MGSQPIRQQPLDKGKQIVEGSVQTINDDLGQPKVGKAKELLKKERLVLNYMKPQDNDLGPAALLF